MSDYEPTIGDLWPNEESMPPEVRELMDDMNDCWQKQLAENEQNRTLPWKSWWQTVTSKAGKVTEVWVNRLTGDEAFLWTIRLTIDDEGHPAYELGQSRHVDEMSAFPIGSWRIDGDIDLEELELVLREFVGARAAKGIVRRLRGGPVRTDLVRTSR